MSVESSTQEDRLQQIRKLTEASRSYTYAASLDEVFRLTVDIAAELLAAEKSLLMTAEDDGMLVLRSAHGMGAGPATDFREPMSETLLPTLAARFDVPPEGLLGVPVVVSGTIRGVLVVIRSAASPRVAEDEWLLSALADQTAFALEKRHLDEIGAFREELIGIISHDLRDPLNTIGLAAQLLVQYENLGEAETELARKITRSASLATRLVAQLLDLTRARLGSGLPIDPRLIDMNDVCRQIIDETELAHPDRPLRADLVGELTGMWDRDRVYQMLVNLVGNAVRHGELHSSITLRVEGGESEMVIDVINRGDPIPPAMLPTIFDAFRQGRTDVRSRTRGLGLGLFISQQIARAHGGSIAVTSSEREGTQFRVRLPRGEIPAAR